MVSRTDFERRPPPHGIKVHDHGDRLEISWTSHWSTAITLIGTGLLFLAAILFLPNIYLIVVAFLLIILGLMELSWTSIVLDRDVLEIRGRSSSFAAETKHEIPARTVQQVFVVERSIGRYELHLLLDNNQSRRTSAESLGGDLNIDVARYLELAIENFLGLTNQPVAGETALHPLYRALPGDPFPDVKFPFSQNRKGIHAAPDQPRATIVKPEGFEVSKDASRLTIGWPQKPWDGLGKFVAWATLIFLGMLLFMVVDAGDTNALIALVLGGLVWLAFLWSRMLPYITRMEIRSDRHELTVRHHPSFFRRECRVAVPDITQLYVVEHIHRNTSTGLRMRGRLEPMPMPPQLHYHLTYVGRGKQVLAELNDAHAALFLEYELEQFLGLDDRPLPGELATKYHDLRKTGTAGGRGGRPAGRSPDATGSGLSPWQR